MATEPKRRKIEPPPLRRPFSSPATEKFGDATSVRAPQAHGVRYKVQEAKNFVVAQAQQEGSAGNFRIFDSPFGNFLVPVITTHAELAG